MTHNNHDVYALMESNHIFFSCLIYLAKFKIAEVSFFNLKNDNLTNKKDRWFEFTPYSC